MDSRNNTPRNEKQEELIKRLEEIRRQRSASESSERRQTQAEESQYEEVEPRRRNEKRQKTTPSRSSNRRRNQRRNTQPTSQTYRPTRQETVQPAQTTHDSTDDIDGRLADSSISQAEIRDERRGGIRSKDVSKKRKANKKNFSKPLLNQLSNGDSLTQAVILNEVLSKPIALRYKNR